MTRKQLFDHVCSYFADAMPEVKPELNYSDAFSLLVAVMLSAQCTDKRVNMITPALLKRYPNAHEMSKAEERDVYDLIASCSYPNMKAKHLVEMSKMLCEKFGGEVPGSMEELESIPGVGRKTASVVASVWFGKQVIAVDTHVHRVAARLGLTKDATTPLATQKQLTEGFPPEILGTAHHWLLLHGRYICIARKPKCDKCGLADVCKNKPKDDLKHLKNR